MKQLQEWQLQDRAPAGYMPQLDGLRAIAVGFVMLWHFNPGIVRPYIWLGDFGVELFFVLRVRPETS